MMDKNKALDKIKKCLALSKSANEHEAAQALKQAQALMRKYEMTEHDVALSGIGTEFSQRRMAQRLATWQWRAARRRYLKECRSRKPSNREYLANRYCEGWLAGARQTVQVFALSETETELMQDYAKNTLKIIYQKPKTIRADSRTGASGELAASLGFSDGKDVQLYHAMNGAEGLKRIGG